MDDSKYNYTTLVVRTNLEKNELPYYIKANLSEDFNSNDLTFELKSNDFGEIVLFYDSTLVITVSFLR